MGSAQSSVGKTEGIQYTFWGDQLYNKVTDKSRTIINLASKEYSKCIEKYLKPAADIGTTVSCRHQKSMSFENTT